MFKYKDYNNLWYLYYIHISIDKLKKGVLKELYEKMIRKEIDYYDYYNSKENKEYWDLMIQCSKIICLKKE